VAEDSIEKKAEKKRHSLMVDALIRLVKTKPLGTAGGIITLILLIVGIFAKFIAPYGMNATGAGPLLAPPSIHFWLGTDNLGRDLLSRIIYGAQISVIVGLVGSALSVLVSTIIGILSGYIGGAFDMVTQRIVDAFMCIPSLIIMMLIVSIVGPGLWPVIIILGITSGIYGSRIVRSATMSIKQNVYLEAAKGIGCSPIEILVKHILPNITATLIVMFSTMVPNLIIQEASLSFLGFGVPPPAPSWGSMLTGDARKFMLQDPGLILWPGVALSLVVYGVNMFGDALRDVLDPRLRGGVGRYGLKVNKPVVAKTQKKPAESVE
jgi:peptide/nickel transport system permease protein